MKIALMGAGGNMGIRVSCSLHGDPDYRVYYVEPSEKGLARMAQYGFAPVAQDEALAEAEVIILALPDALVGSIAEEIVPLLNPDTLVVGLDPAAAYARRLPQRPDIAYFVVHPTHPPFFDLLQEPTPEARSDFWGGGFAHQSLVCALVQGSEADYARGEALARRIFRPIKAAYRVTIEQMALLEPAMAETLAVTCLAVIREGMDEVIKMGVPEEAARDFMLGHIQLGIAILFGGIEWKLSAGAVRAVKEAKKAIFQPDWKHVFELEAVKKSVDMITAKPVSQ